MWTTFKNLTGFELFLSSAILAFIAIALLAIVLLFISRSSRNYRKKLQQKYDPLIETILFSLLFFNKSLDEVLALPEYTQHYKKPKFRLALLAGVYKLHQNYAGDFNHQLEAFYTKTGLIKISMAKLKDDDWDIVCTGIRELSQLNVQEIEPRLYKLMMSKRTHKLLQLEAILGLIRLKGLAGLALLLEYKRPINDWIQANILHAVRNSDRRKVVDFSAFLNSKNESVVLLGLRLIAMFNQAQHVDLIHGMFMLNGMGKVKNQAALTLEKLSAIHVS